MSTYLLACIAMGLGIGFDVVLATLSRLRHISSQNSWLWVKRISFTHVLFPMIGYYFFIGLFRSYSFLRILLGIIAFSLVAIFLFDIVKGWLSQDSQDSDESPFAWAVVLSVSWDALFSGPAKSAQAIGWSSRQVLISFVISGFVVMSMAHIAVIIAKAIQRAITDILGTEVYRLSMLHLAMMYFEFVILFYFGVLAFTRYTLESELSFTAIAAISVVSGAILFMLLWTSLLHNTHLRVGLTIAGCKADKADVDVNNYSAPQNLDN